MTFKLSTLLSFALLLTLSAQVFAQDRLTARGNSVQSQPASAANDNDRTRDGLTGPVRRIRSEVTKVTNTDGKIVENGKRVPLEAAEYDLKGTKTVNQYFPVAGAAAPTGREVYKYDDKGNISEMTLMGSDGSMVSKEIYKYEYDSLGNWTKMTTSVAVVENGAIAFEPTEVTHRTISYYLDSRMNNLLQPSNNVAAAPAKPEAKVAANNAEPNSKSASQQTLAPLQFTRRSPITVGGSPVVVDVRNASFVTNQTVAVENAPPPPAPPRRAPVSGGVLNGSAIDLPTPAYPDAARRMRIEGTVEVEVVIDENGKVISAKAVSGPVSLRDSAAQAALRARFTPSKLSGQPVQVSGKILYNFKMAR